MKKGKIIKKDEYINFNLKYYIINNTIFKLYNERMV